MSEDAYIELVKIENFLSLKHAFDPNHLIFKEKKGFCRYLLDVKQIHDCMDNEKKVIKPEIIHKLRQHLAPYNEKFYAITGRNFNW